MQSGGNNHASNLWLDEPPALNCSECAFRLNSSHSRRDRGGDGDCSDTSSMSRASARTEASCVHNPIDAFMSCKTVCSDEEGVVALKGVLNGASSCAPLACGRAPKSKRGTETHRVSLTEVPNAGTEAEVDRNGDAEEAEEAPDPASESQHLSSTRPSPSAGARRPTPQRVTRLTGEAPRSTSQTPTSNSARRSTSLLRDFKILDGSASSATSTPPSCRTTASASGKQPSAGDLRRPPKSAMPRRGGTSCRAPATARALPSRASARRSPHGRAPEGEDGFEPQAVEAEATPRAPAGASPAPRSSFKLPISEKRRLMFSSRADWRMLSSSEIARISRNASSARETCRAASTTMPCKALMFASCCDEVKPTSWRKASKPAALASWEVTCSRRPATSLRRLATCDATSATAWARWAASASTTHRNSAAKEPSSELSNRSRTRVSNLSMRSKTALSNDLTSRMNMLYHRARSNTDGCSPTTLASDDLPGRVLQRGETSASLLCSVSAVHRWAQAASSPSSARTPAPSP